MPFNERGQENQDRAKAQNIANKFNAGQPTTESEITFVMSRGYGGMLNTVQHEEIATSQQTITPTILQAIKTSKVTTSKPSITILEAIKRANIKEPHGVEVGGSQIYATPPKQNVIVLAPSFTTMPSNFGVRGQTIETKPMDINPIIETFVHAPSMMGVRGQTIDTKSMDVLAAKPEVTASIIQAMTTTREDILHGQGLELPPKSAAMALADYGVVGEALGGFISPIDNLVLLVGKFARHSTMEKVMYNPTAFGVPIQAATSFFTGALTGKPTERAGVEAQSKFLMEHPVYAGTSVIGDIFLGWVSGKVVSGVGGAVGGKARSLYENWRYGKVGSEKFLSSIAKGTIVNPETGMTTYTGFAAKQASRLSPGIVSLPFGTTKSLPRILSGVSEETAMGAMDFSMDLTMTPHASAFSISKLANPAYIRPSLPIYQMIGGALVNVSELATSWGDPNAKFEMFPKTKTAIESTSIQTDFEQLGFKNVITPKETPFTGFKDMTVGYSGSAPQRLYMKASNVFSEVKSMFADTKSAYRMELVLNKPSTSFMETSVQGISAGMSLPSARLIGAKATSFAYTGAMLPLLGSYKATATEKEYVKAQNEMYEKGGYSAPTRITLNTKLSSTFAFPTSTGAFPVIPDITMGRQSARLETKHSDIEEYLGLSAKLFQSQAGERAYKAPAIQVQQLTRLKPKESAIYIPKIANYLGAQEREGLDLVPFAIAGVAAVPISASVVGLKEISLIKMDTVMKSGWASPFGHTPPDIFGTIPGVPFTFPKLGGAGSGGGGRRGYGKWFKMTRPILEPKQVWKQFWGMPKLSVSRVGVRGKRNKVTVTRVGSRSKRSKRKK